MTGKSAFASIATCIVVLFAASAHGTEHNRSRVIVRLRPAGTGPSVITKSSSGRADFDRLVRTFRIEQVRQFLSPAHTPAKGRAAAQRLRVHDYAIVTIPAPLDPDQFLATLRQSPDVERADFDVIVRAVGGNVTPNDPYFATSQYALVNTGTQPSYDPGTADADIDMDGGWEYTTGDPSIVLAILDTGLDLGHPEFQNRLWFNPDEEANEEDDDGNGLVDDLLGWNFNSDNNGTSDDHGHGTHVAGIAAASGNNGVGIAGIDWQCKIMPVKVLGADGSGTTSAIAFAIMYAANEGADVISMSLGGPGASVESTAVAYAQALGVVVVAAMGNDDVGTLQYPAAYPNVVSVGATDSDDQRAKPFCYSPTSGSNYGAWIDVCAPGDNVWSAYITALGSYANLCGTSMATPHVSGLVSLMMSLRPGWDTDSVLHILRNTSDDEVGRPTEDTPGFDIYHGWGRINAARALRLLAVAFPPVLTTTDSVETTEAVPMSFPLSATDSNLTTLAFSMPPLPNAVLTDHGDGTATFEFTPDYTQSGEYTVEFVVTDGALADTSVVVVTVANGCQCPCYADPDCNGTSGVVDVVTTVGVAFRAQSPIIDPDCFPNPGGRTDVNCNGSTDVVDVVMLIDAAFRNQSPTFCNPCAL